MTAPTASQSLTGTSFTFLSSAVSLPASAAVEYDVDGELACISRAGGIWPCVWNPYYASNGTHSIVAIARGVANNVLATSPAVAFSVAEPLPQQTSPATTTTAVNGPAPTMTVGFNINWGANVFSLKTSGTSMVSQAVAVKSAASPGASMATNTFSSASTDTLVVYAVMGTATSITVTNVGGATWSCGTFRAGSGGNYYPSQWCVGTGNGGSGSDAITVHYSPNETSNAQIFSFKATNIAASPIDGDALTTGGSGKIQAAPIPVAQTGEAIFLGASWNHALDPVTAGVGYTVLTDSVIGISGAEYAVMPSNGNWLGQWGITATVSPNTGTPSKTATLFVDGQSAVTSLAFTSASTSVFLPTQNFQNIAHQVLLRVDGPNCSGCLNAVWSDMGAWEQTITFANPVVASDLRIAPREAFLCVTNTATCHYPTSVTLTGNVTNTDSSTTSATLTCGAPSTSSVTQSSCTFTAASVGFAAVTTTDSVSGLTRPMYILVLPQDGLPHVSKTGTILTAFNPSTSTTHISQFYSDYMANSDSTWTIYKPSQFGKDFIASGFTAMEHSIISPPSVGTVEPTFHTNVNADVTPICNTAATYGLKVHLIGDNWAGGSSQLGVMSLGPGPGYSTPAWQYYMQQYQTCATAISVTDEVLNKWGYAPLEGVGLGGLQPGNGSQLQSISVSGTTATVTCSPGCSIGGANTFLIHGDTGPCASVLNYNASTGTPLFHGPGGTSWTFTVGSSCTGNASSTATLEPYAVLVFDTNLNQPPTGGPWTLYNTYNTFYQMRGWHLAAGGPLMGWPPTGFSGAGVVPSWCGNVYAGSPSRNMADDCEAYWNPNGQFLPGRIDLGDVQQSLLNTELRTDILPYMNLTLPLMVETEGVSLDFAEVGYPATVVSCVGNTITFSDHGVRNRFPGNTRLKVTGSSGGNCDGFFYVLSIPDSAHLVVDLANSTFSANPSSGTLTWQDNSTNSISTDLHGIQVNSSDYSHTQLSPAINFSAKRGMTFTISGSGTAADGVSFAYDFDVSDFNAAGVGFNPGLIRQIPNFTASTGGTALIVPYNSYVRGSHTWATNSEVGPRYFYAAINTAYLERAAASRQYGSALTGCCMVPDYYDRTGLSASNTYTATNYTRSISTPDLSGQAFINPHWDYANTFQDWVATAHANLLVKYLGTSGLLFQPSLASPDYGPYFETMARTSSYGNLLGIQFYGDNTETCTANLSPYLLTGQPIYRYYGTWSGISVTTLSPGTASDSMTCDPGAFRAYVFPASGGGINAPMTPVVNMKLSDVTNATAAYVQYAYSPLVFDTNGVAPQTTWFTVACSTNSCTIPADRQIGTIYYRLVYVNSSGKVLATSAVQTI
ncbi:MAG TPA: hypothetical protein VKX49_12520 [Bryobacteraceae bacterium]|nr:hypothetical protein [Bryobacteraceae bacterium]